MSRSRLRESLLALAMLSPSLVLFGVFVFYPLVRTFYLGLHQNDFILAAKIHRLLEEDPETAEAG